MILQLPVLRTARPPAFLGDGIFDDSITAVAAGTPDPAATAATSAVTTPTVAAPDSTFPLMLGAGVVLAMLLLK